MNFEDYLKSFGMTNMLLETELDNIEKSYNVDLGREIQKAKATEDIERSYFPQFDKDLRLEAQQMARVYELFYCLEKTIRSFLSEILEASEGVEWWNSKVVPVHIIGEVKKRIQREREAGITLRSSEPLDYTSFGELGEIIKNNWPLFGSVFNNLKAVEKVMFNLNTLRNPIAHCSMLAEDEKLRLEISLRDWFRLLE